MKGPIEGFAAVRRSLDETGIETCALWLRDDDAIAATPALDQFRAQCTAGGVAPLIAAIPGRVSESLVDDARQWPVDWRVAVHGWHHRNHAAAGVKKSEFPDTRDLAASMSDLVEGKARLEEAFGARMLPVFVPPWNRIGDTIPNELPRLGYRGFSTFANAYENVPHQGVQVINTHVDLIDWRGGRVGKSVDQVAAELAAAVRGRREIVGVLTHHLDHDVHVRQTLDALFAFVASEPRLVWQTPSLVFNQATDRHL